MKPAVVPEIDVLIATAKWLYHRRGALPLRYSLATGSGIDAVSDRERLETELEEAGVLFIDNLVGEGPDLVAASDGELWLVECKGSGAGKSSTQRNNFDRALASAVTYYGYMPEAESERVQILGLALPRTPDYVANLSRRLRVVLRQRLNLWVLLLDPGTGVITAIGPSQEISDSIG